MRFITVLSSAALLPVDLSVFLIGQNWLELFVRLLKSRLIHRAGNIFSLIADLRLLHSAGIRLVSYYLNSWLVGGLSSQLSVSCWALCRLALGSLSRCRPDLFIWFVNWGVIVCKFQAFHTATTLVFTVAPEGVIFLSRRSTLCWVVPSSFAGAAWMLHELPQSSAAAFGQRTLCGCSVRGLVRVSWPLSMCEYSIWLCEGHFWGSCIKELFWGVQTWY